MVASSASCSVHATHASCAWDLESHMHSKSRWPFASSLPAPPALVPGEPCRPGGPDRLLERRRIRPCPSAPSTDVATGPPLVATSAGNVPPAAVARGSRGPGVVGNEDDRAVRLPPDRLARRPVARMAARPAMTSAASSSMSAKTSVSGRVEAPSQPVGMVVRCGALQSDTVHVVWVRV